MQISLGFEGIRALDSLRRKESEDHALAIGASIDSNERKPRWRAVRIMHCLRVPSSRRC